MLEETQKVVIFAEAAMGLANSKTAEGILRFGKNPIVAVIDSTQAGKTVRDVTDMDLSTPILARLEDTLAENPEVLILGTAPSGGMIPQDWYDVIDQAVAHGMSVVNGSHDVLADRYRGKLAANQWIWDIRSDLGGFPPIAMARAAALNNLRCLMVGTDMAVGKKTAGLEIWKALRAAGADAEFLATGQTGVCITGKGIPLDAFRVDHGGGAVERMVFQNKDHDFLLIEGQGSLLHPGSTATLPLMRGSCCNAMILCHRAGMTKLDMPCDVFVPPIPDVIRLNEAVAVAAGALTPAKVIGIALNTRVLPEPQAKQAIADLAAETGLPVQDPVRFGGQTLARALMDVKR